MSGSARWTWIALSLALAACATGPRHSGSYAEALKQLKSINGFAFSKDMRTAFVSLPVEDKDPKGRGRARIFARDLTGDGWGPPRPVSFSDRHTDYQPIVSPDGRTLYYTSTRPIDPGGPEVRQNVWAVPLRDRVFGKPTVVRELIADGWDGHAVRTASGTIYFASDRGGHTDIWFSRSGPDGLAAPVNLTAVNSPAGESDLYVDPAEHYLIFGRYDEQTKEIELFASVRRRGEWLPPKALDMVNRPGMELSPTVTPDGRWFLFQRDGQVEVFPWKDVRHHIDGLFRN